MGMPNHLLYQIQAVLFDHRLVIEQMEVEENTKEIPKLPELCARSGSLAFRPTGLAGF
jgi:hypothetical protein